MSASPCKIAVPSLGAFTQRLADNLASLRPIVVATTFDSAETVAATRRVSATLAAYLGLDQTLGGCEATGELAQRVGLMMSGAESILKQARSTNAEVRQTAVSLFALLPEVLALSKAAKEVADSLGIAYQIAQVPEGATKAVGSLPPLATPKPKSTPTSTPRPTPQPTTGGGGSGGSGWDQDAYNAAVAYQRSVLLTYGTDVPAWIAQLMSMDTAGSTPDEVYAMTLEGAVLVKLATTSVNTHLAFMNSRPAARCFRDAYAADQKIANSYLAFLSNWFPTSGPEKRYQEFELSGIDAEARAFSSRFDSYFADCK